MATQLTIEDLPGEVLVEIFSRLPRADLVNNVQFVCVRWKELACSASLWNNYSFSPPPDYSTQRIIKLLLKMPCLKSFCFSERIDVHTVSDALCKYCPELRSISFTDPQSVSQYNLIQFCENLPELESLELSRRCLDDDYVMSALKKCSKLNELKFCWFPDDYAMSNYDQERPGEYKDLIIKTLKHVEVFSNYRTPLIDTLIRDNADRLISLRLVGLYYELVSLVPTCHNLETLKLNFLSRPCRELPAIFSKIGKLKRLKSLCMRQLVESEKNSLGSLFAGDNLPSLIELDISHCMSFSLDVAKALVRCCPNLRVLKMQACAGLKDDQFAVLIRCRELQVLDISGCKWLTERSLCLIPTFHHLHTLVYTWIPAITRLMMEAMAGAVCLRKVYLDHSQVAQADIVYFANMTTNLAYLSLYKCRDLNPDALRQAIRSVRLEFNNKPPWPAS